MTGPFTWSGRVSGRRADLVVGGQLSDPGAVEQPAQDQYRLPVAARRPGSGPCPETSAFGVQQTGHEQHGVLGYGQCGGVCDTHGGAGPWCEVLCEKSTSYRGSALSRCITTPSACPHTTYQAIALLS